MHKVSFVEGEYYHIYNRGVDKRDIFSDRHDFERFFQSMGEFNSVEPIGSIYEMLFLKSKAGYKADGKPKLFFGRETSKLGLGETGKDGRKEEKLVEFINYCVNPNHFHFTLAQLVDGGISEFMKRLGGYTKYFNEKYNRNGALFQGVFKSKHINSNEYLLHLSAYINLNPVVHNYLSLSELGRETSKFCKSSWEEYKYKKTEKNIGFCNTSFVLEQFNGAKEYEDFATESLEDIIRRKSEEKELADLLIEE